MAFDANMERALVSALNTEDVSRDLLTNITTNSAAMSLFRTVQMARNQTRLPVIETLPMSYFVNGETGLKQTTDMSWSNKYLNVEELATIIPIPEAVLDDSEYDIWGAVKPLAVNSAIRAIDNAIFFGVGKPGTWDPSIVSGATAASNVVVRGTHDAAHGSLAGDISDLFKTVEAEGYNPSGVIANVTYKGNLRNARDVQGERLDELSPTEVYGIPVTYPLEGLWPAGLSAPEMITGDFRQEDKSLRYPFAVMTSPAS